MAKAFELAERLGGMTAFELMARMSVEEIRLWVEYDRVKSRIPPTSTYQFAAIMAKLDWIKGVKNPDPSRYLPKVDGPRQRPRRTFAQLKINFDCAVANSSRLALNPSSNPIHVENHLNG